MTAASVDWKALILLAFFTIPSPLAAYTRESPKRAAGSITGLA